ncbi:MAG: energy transducer TonB [Pseudomonadota bacterium]
MNKKSQDNLFLALAVSIASHLAILALFAFGLPAISKKLPEEQVIAIEMLPVTEVSNIKTQKVQQEKALEEEKAKEIKKSKEVEKEPEKKKELAKEKEPEKEKPKPEEVKPEPSKDVVKIKDKEKKPEPKKEPPKKEPPKKEAPKKKKNPDTDLDSLLKTLEKASEGSEAKSNKRTLSEKTDATKEAKGQFNEEMPLSISEYNLLRQQVERHWNVPAGAQNAGEIKITIYISLKPDGAVDKAELKDKQCGAAGATLCEAAADGALRAVWLASPFQNLSADRYDSWKEFNIEFDPSQILP